MIDSGMRFVGVRLPFSGGDPVVRDRDLEGPCWAEGRVGIP